MSKNLRATSLKREEMPSLIGDVNMLLPIESLGLSVRTISALKVTRDDPKIWYIGQLIALPDHELLRRRNLGAKHLREISATLAERGYIAGEGLRHIVGMKFEAIHNLREVYQIPDTVPTPTEWERRTDRQKIEDPLAASKVARQFSASLSVTIPREPESDEEIQKLRGVCQKAFEVAIRHAVQNALYPEQETPVQDALKAALPFDAEVDGLICSDVSAGYVFTADITLSAHATKAFENRFLRKIAQSIDGAELAGFVGAALKSADGPQ